jgi:hypothetical protein
MKINFATLRPAIFGAMAIATSACSLKDLVDVGAIDEGAAVLSAEYMESRAGAVETVLGAYRQLQLVATETSFQVGLVTDELTLRPPGDANHRATLVRLDSRTLSSNQLLQEEFLSYRITPTTSLFGAIGRARVHAMQGRDLLARFPDDSLMRYRALALITEGYANLVLAENFCSGVPLSTARYKQDIQYSQALPTRDVFRAALMMFDSVRNVTSDSTLLTAARILSMRAYVGLGDLDSAYALSQGIDPTFTYNLSFTTTVGPTGSSSGAFWTHTGSTEYPNLALAVEVVNHEGGIGRQWFDAVNNITDPRVPIQTTIVGGVPVIPAVARTSKFHTNNPQYPLARGVEALLVRAEYQAARGGDWLAPLNEARALIGLPDTTVSATNPDIDMIFSERAAWFYLEGRRLHDFRRLVRQYGKDPYEVYPTGTYTRGGAATTFYGSAYVFTPDFAEFENNYRYKGCISLNP